MDTVFKDTTTQKPRRRWRECVRKRNNKTSNPKEKNKSHFKICILFKNPCFCFSIWAWIDFDLGWQIYIYIYYIHIRVCGCELRRIRVVVWIFRNGEQMEESQNGFRTENVSLCSEEFGRFISDDICREIFRCPFAVSDLG